MVEWLAMGMDEDYSYVCHHVAVAPSGDRYVLITESVDEARRRRDNIVGHYLTSVYRANDDNVARGAALHVHETPDFDMCFENYMAGEAIDYHLSVAYALEAGEAPF